MKVKKTEAGLILFLYFFTGGIISGMVFNLGDIAIFMSGIIFGAFFILFYYTGMRLKLISVTLSSGEYILFVIASGLAYCIAITIPYLTHLINLPFNHPEYYFCPMAGLIGSAMLSIFFNAIKKLPHFKRMLLNIAIIGAVAGSLFAISLDSISYFVQTFIVFGLWQGCVGAYLGVSYLENKRSGA